MRDRKLKKQPREGERLPFVPPFLPPFFPPSVLLLSPPPAPGQDPLAALFHAERCRRRAGRRQEPHFLSLFLSLSPLCFTRPARQSRSGATRGAECSRGSRAGSAPSPAGEQRPGWGRLLHRRGWRALRRPQARGVKRRDLQRRLWAASARGWTGLASAAFSGGIGCPCCSVAKGLGVPGTFRWCFGDAPE